MNKTIKIILIIITILLLFIIDIFFIYTLNKPIFAIKKDNVYKGILYDTYICNKVPQIKSKFNKYNCKISINKVINIKDTTKDIKDFACAEALEQFYEDDKYTYYYSCIKSKYIIVKYESGYEETVSDALKNNRINITDLDNYNINYIKYDKEN